ncbi:HWE histidine kinase domain-containing protein [Roseobacter sp. GAI101]|uniref:HWE histidine kinase domain-containing protein n=1 Tax=Roseobacter sp. (strain GAI101) TaxID=391589 RepID=UPI0001871630|nr:HWE histidine kinase domain-containing protein [Roseobacter sp. GAI101]EEB83055.1 signal transduction histidine kinase [Roseobacter sp. GAI101]
MPTRSPDEMAKELLHLQEELAAHNDETTARRNKARNASNRLSFLEAMMETVPIGVIMADGDGQILYGNSHVEKMVRHPVFHSESTDSYDEWVSFHEDGSRVQSHEYPLARVILENEDHSEIDVNYKRGDGTFFWMRIICEPVRDGEGQRIGATVALIDIEEERRLREAQNILIAELNHRVKNAFSVVKSIVSQSLRKMRVQIGLRETIDQRLNAYAVAHSKLVGTTWDRAAIGAVAADVLDPIGNGRIIMNGPQIEIPSRQALAFSMAFYELATNAMKYGALSVPDGRVNLSWEQTETENGSAIELHWIETGGPGAEKPKETGFGSIITGRALQMETGGEIKTFFEPDGYKWHLRMPQQTEDHLK